MCNQLVKVNSDCIVNLKSVNQIYKDLETTIKFEFSSRVEGTGARGHASASFSSKEARDNAFILLMNSIE